MRLLTLIVAGLLGPVISEHNEGTLFNEEEAKSPTDYGYVKSIYVDYQTMFVAYNDVFRSYCYLQHLDSSLNIRRFDQKTPYVSGQALSKMEASKLAGPRIVEFCRGSTIFLLHKMMPKTESTLESLENEVKKNEIGTKRIRRQTTPFHGRFRGQTQSQYLNVNSNGEKKEGKAEAKATHQSSHAVVSGSNGMGQAQSMSFGSGDCENCPSYTGSPQSSDRTTVMGGGHLPGTVSGIIGIGTGETVSGGMRPGIPGTLSGVGGVMQGSRVPGSGFIPGISSYPNGVASVPVTIGGIPGRGNVPGSFGIIPEVGGVPGSRGIMPETGSVPGSVGVMPGMGIIPGSGGIIPGTSSVPRSEGIMPGTVGIQGSGGVIPGMGTIPGRGVVTSGTGSISGSRGVISGMGSIPGSGVVMPGTGSIPGMGTIPGSRGIIPETGSVPGSGSIIPGVGNFLESGGVMPGITPGIYSTGVVPGVSGTIPVTNSGIPRTGGVSGTGHIIPGTGSVPGSVSVISRTNGVPGSGSVYPIGITSGTPNINAGRGGLIPGIFTPGTTHDDFPPGVMPGTSGVTNVISGVGNIPGTSGIVPGTAPGGYLPTATGPGITGSVVSTGSGVVPGGVAPGPGNTILYPGGIAPSIYPGVGGMGTYPSDSGGTITSRTEVTPGSPSGGTIQTIGLPSSYPGSSGIIYPGSYPGQVSGSYPGQVPSQSTPGTSAAGQGMYYETTRLDDNSDSHAEGSVKQNESGTHASASAQGKFSQGTAQSQVSGTYTGSGSFSAQAGTSDNNKSAQTQVNGGKEGAASNAQGMGGYGKSQTQVQLDSDTGATSTNAQSSGWNHGTNSQVQASVRGGMADAQANGEGSTSSQAQVGFQPYTGANEEVKKRSRPFRGGGTASAQSGTFRGQSQSQLQGSFQYGITYNGAAQAGSGSGASASRKPFNFTTNNFDMFKQFKFADVKTNILNSSKFDEQDGAKKMTKENSSVKDSLNKQDDYEYEEYEDYGTPISSSKTTFIKSESEMSKSASLNSERDLLEPGQSVDGYTIPAGFRGRVVPEDRQGKLASPETRSLRRSSAFRHGGKIRTNDANSQTTTMRPSFFTVTNSVAGKLDTRNPSKKYEHRYYTKSSTCGYFTFSCNVVHGSNGRTKICKPRIPIYPDGTPMKC